MLSLLVKGGKAMPKYTTTMISMKDEDAEKLLTLRKRGYGVIDVFRVGLNNLIASKTSFLRHETKKNGEADTKTSNVQPIGK
jgi:hypothetical protein